MIDYNKVKEHTLKMQMNEAGYLKLTQIVMDYIYGMNKPFTEEEFHQAIEYQKELVKKNIENSNLSDEEKKRRKQYFDRVFPVIEEEVKNHLVRIR